MMTKAKKSLGQHWLRSKKALVQIIAAGDIRADDVVLEIGPGQGVLTERLLKLAGKVIAVEKDRELTTFLKEKFRKEIDEGKLNILEKDILDFDLGQGPTLFAIGQGRTLSYKIIANIPYYITGAILKKFLTADFPPKLMVLLIQKEVAERVLARDGKESLLSLSVKAYGRPKIIARVPRGSFAPPPKVDSAILLIADISKALFKKEKISEKKFFEILKKGFAHKRKLLKGNLEALAKKERIESVFERCEIPKKARPEELKLKNWVCLTGEFTKKTKIRSNLL